MDISIRPATVDDARAIGAVHVASWRNAYRGIVSDEVLNQLSVRRRASHWRQRLSDESANEVTYVALDDENELIGFASGGRERDSDREFSGELFAIYLLQETQRQGIGRKLAFAVLEEIHNAGHNNILVWVLATNPARKFFEQIGATAFRERTVDIDGVEHLEIGYGWLTSR